MAWLVLDPRRGRRPVPDADPEGSVAVWQITDGGGQRGGDEGRSCGGEGGGGFEQVAAAGQSWVEGHRVGWRVDC